MLSIYNSIPQLLCNINARDDYKALKQGKNQNNTRSPNFLLYYFQQELLNNCFCGSLVLVKHKQKPKTNLFL